MSIKDKINTLIENDPIVKEIYDKNDGCFRNVVMPCIMNTNNDNETLVITINSLASLSKICDALLNNVAQFGTKELIDKCNYDIQSILSEE